MTRRNPEQYDFEELEFDEQMLRKHYTSIGGPIDKDYTVAHHMTIIGKGTGSALDACYKVWQNRKASAQYGVDGEEIGQFVLDKDYAWATGSSTGNLKGISIEHANSTAGPGWKISETTWRTGAKLTAYIHKKYKLGRPRSNAAGATGSMRKHSSFVATACPGPFFKTIWDEYVAEAQKIYDQITGVVVPPKPTPNVALWGKPETWNLGATGNDVNELGERIAAWSKALDLPCSDTGKTFNEAKRKALSKLQVAWGFGSSAKDLAKGGHSDGYPGLQTFNKLESDPPVVEPPKPNPTGESSMWGGYGNLFAPYTFTKDWLNRAPKLAKLVRQMGVSWFVGLEGHGDTTKAGGDGRVELAKAPDGKLRPIYQPFLDALGPTWKVAEGEGGNHLFYDSAKMEILKTRDELMPGKRWMTGWKVRDLDPGGEYWINGAHFSAGRTKDRVADREAQGRFLAKAVDATKPVIVCADLNNPSKYAGSPRRVLEADGLRGLREKSSTPVVNGRMASHDGGDPGEWLDDMLTSSLVKVDKAELVPTGSLSDHVFFKARFTVPAR